MIEVFKKTPIFRVIIFLVILFLLINSVTTVLLYRDRIEDNTSYQVVNFYKEKRDSAEVVFVGSSNCFSFYSPLFAYNAYGIKTTNFSSSGMGMVAYKYAVEEVKKTQSKAKIVVTVTPLDEMSYSGLHYLADYMPWSMNKLNLLKKYFSQRNESILNSIEYFIPIMRFHERWSEVNPVNIKLDDGTKGATSHIYYLSYVNDISKDYFVSDEREEIPDDWDSIMNDLLDYCDESNTDIVFLFPPRSYTQEEYQRLNSLIDLIEKRHYTVMDLRDKLELIGLNPTYDFYDIRHTNVHGSIKYTDYVIKEVTRHYGLNLEFERDEEYDKAFSVYYEKIRNYVLDVELDMKNRNYHLNRPELLLQNENDERVSIHWDPIENADGYLVYKNGLNGWELVEDVKDATSYTVEGASDDSGLYTVISYRNENGTLKYGNYDYKGIQIGVNQ